MPEVSLSSDPAYNAARDALAQTYHFPVDTNATLQLFLDESGLSFFTTEKPKERLRIDFLRGRMGYRLGTAGHTRQPLLRAIGFKNDPLTVIDATAGLGRDMMTMAMAGCTVQACERAPILAALLYDAIQRARNEDDAFAEVIATRLRLAHIDARTYLRHQHTQQPDVVYLDPMFPHRRKSALVKKEMRLIRLASGADQDAPALLAAACATAKQRVVVKRPADAPPLQEPVSHQIREKTVRFDIYHI